MKSASKLANIPYPGLFAAVVTVVACCDLTTVYKIFNGFLRVDPTFFFSVSNESRTRGHNCRIKMSHTRLDIRKYWFSNRVVPDWNSLPATCVEAPSVDIFKQELWKHLGSLGVHWFVSFFLYIYFFNYLTFCPCFFVFLISLLSCHLVDLVNLTLSPFRVFWLFLESLQ